MSDKEYEQEYQTACEGAAFYLHPNSGLLTLAGSDRIDFLHRQSTQDMHMLAPERAVLTVLTSPTARILDVLWVIASDDRLSVFTLPGHGKTTATFLSSMVFFMDKVTVSDDSDEFEQVDVIGPRAREVLGASLSIAPPERAGGVIQATLADVPVIIVNLGERLSHPAYRLCLPTAACDTFVGLLKQNQASPIGETTYDLLRIEAGIPGEVRELTEDYTPLEMGLLSAISDTKGCYTGQEVIARQVSYDKVARHLVGIRLSSQVEPGTKLYAEDRAVGEVTSVGVSPRFGTIGLAIVRRSYAVVGTSLAVNNGKKSTATISSLPFVE